jgi:hypothetical protein
MERLGLRLIVGTIGAFSMALLTACSSSSGNSAPVGKVADLCGNNGVQCGDGLYCAQGGEMAGRCTADCATDTGLCASHFGNNTFCIDSTYCTKMCSTVSDCGGAGKCVQIVLNPYSGCVSQ